MLSLQRAVNAKSTTRLSAIAVSAHSGYWLLPRKPSWAKKFRDTTTIVNQRAQLCIASKSEACEHEQHAPDQHHPAPGRQVDHEETGCGHDVVLVVEQGDQTLEEVDATEDQHHDASEADPACHRGLRIRHYLTCTHHYLPVGLHALGPSVVGSRFEHIGVVPRATCGKTRMPSLATPGHCTSRLQAFPRRRTTDALRPLCA